MVSWRITSLLGRSLAVWWAVTAAVATVAALTPGAVAPTVRHLTRPGQVRADFADLLVTACAAGLLLALAWLWLVTTVTVIELATGRFRAGGGATRRLVLAACGAAVLAGTAAPALASGDRSPVLAGLSLPDRTVSSTEVRPGAPSTRRAPRPIAVRPPPAPRDHVVRPGDSLWSIAEATPGAAGSIDERWRAIWAANRPVIGDDPDLILPGQHLRLPGPTHPDEGERR